MREWGIFLLLILLWTSAQILLKLGMRNFSGRSVDIRFFREALTSRPILAGLLLSTFAAFVWLIVLSRFELSYSNLIASSSFVLIVVASAVFLGEDVSLAQWIGTFLIALGVFLVVRSR